MTRRATQRAELTSDAGNRFFSPRQRGEKAVVSKLTMNKSERLFCFP